MKIISAIVVLSLGLFSCRPTTSEMGAGNASGLASVDLALPDLNSNAAIPDEIKTAINGFALIITPLNCTGQNVKSVDVVREITVKQIQSTLTANCAYRIELKLGTLLGAGGAKSLSPSYYEGIKSLTATEVKPGNIKVQIELRATQTSINNGAAPGTIMTPLVTGETNAVIEGVIVGSPSQPGTPLPPAASPQQSDTTSSAAVKCKKEDAMWTSSDGGCKNLQYGIVFSDMLGFQGVVRKYSHAQAKSECESLVQGGMSDWRLPTKAQMEKLRGSLFSSYVKFKSYFWLADLHDNNGRAYYYRRYFEDAKDANATEPEEVLCVRGNN